MTTAEPIDLDRLGLADIRAGALRDRRVTVLGLARSGTALARFFVDAGAEVTIYDGRPAADLEPGIHALGGRAVTLALGPEVEPAATWADADLVATSPSINPDFPTTEPRLRAALQSLVGSGQTAGSVSPRLVSEADFFLRLCPSPTIGVTGTKGKTTTSSLIADILATDPVHPVVLGGNIGTPLVDRLHELTPKHRVVIELSELQLPTLTNGTTVAVYTNVTSDHLDRHGSVAAYRRAKRRLVDLVDPDGALVLNLEDPVVAAYAAGGSARSVGYRRSAPQRGQVGISRGWIVTGGVDRLEIGGRANDPIQGERIVSVDALRVPGAHNVSNALAAVAVGLLFGIDLEAIGTAVNGFGGVEHRLEPVAIVGGVRFINDSQGTQPDAVAAALRSFEAPLVLIAGGRDKGIDLSGLAPVVAERAAAAVLIGESGPALEAAFRAAGLVRTERAEDLDSAVHRADTIARDLRAAMRSSGSEPGMATVLLSPAAASFDMFSDYADRGRAFKAIVGSIVAEQDPEDVR